MNDPIVNEVRAIRAKLMAACDYDLNKLLRRIKAMEDEHPDKMVTRKQLDAMRGRHDSASR